MIYEKCPRCELNYKSSDEKYCSVCMRELEGDTFDEEEDAERLCIFCGLRPVLRNDMCARCLKKIRRRMVAAIAFSPILC